MRVNMIEQIKNSESLVELPSVGSLLNPKTGIIYPQYSGTDEPDLSCPIDLGDGEVAADWWDELSSDDYDTLVILGWAD